MYDLEKMEREKCNKEKLLNLKEILSLNKIINSDLDDEKKIDLLCNFCNFRILLNSLNYYSMIDTEIREYQYLKEIIDFCSKNNYIKYSENSYKCSNEEINTRIKKLIEVDSILNSNVSDYSKVEKLISLFKNSEEFRKSYSLLIKYGSKDPKLDPIRNILNNFDELLSKFKKYENAGIIDDIKYLTSIYDYQKNYEYALFALNYYINYYDSYKKRVFLSQLGIDEDYFDFCVDTVKELNVDLYNKYLKKKEKNKKVRYQSIYNTFFDITSAIRNGYFNDGTPFELLEFIKRLPFKHTKNQITNIFEFINHENKKNNNYFNLIINYMYKNRLINTTALNKLNINTINRNKCIINGIEITDEVNDKIINYLKVNNIPLVNKAYSIVRSKYVNGEIDLECNNKNNKIKSIIIIPGNKKAIK